MTDGKSHISSPCETLLSFLQPTLLIIMRLRVRGKGSLFTGAGESELVITLSYIKERQMAACDIETVKDRQTYICYVLHTVYNMYTV